MYATISQQTITDARNLDLDEVAVSLGLVRDRYDHKKWRNPYMILSIDSSNSLFFDHLNQKGGRGAIDLTMHVRNCNFKDAVAFLNGSAVITSITNGRTFPKPAQKKVKPPKCNILDPRFQQQVHDYLHLQRGLPSPLLHYFFQYRYIAADCYSNAVFFRHTIDPTTFKRGSALGASLRSTKGNLKLLTSGTKRDRCWFFFQTHKRVIERVFLTESPIDAISLATIHHHRGQLNALYLSVDGCGSLPNNALQNAIAHNIPVTCAFDNDEAGRTMTHNVQATFPDVQSIYPTTGKDWNDYLLALTK